MGRWMAVVINTLAIFLMLRFVNTIARVVNIDHLIFFAITVIIATAIYYYDHELFASITIDVFPTRTILPTFIGALSNPSIWSVVIHIIAAKHVQSVQADNHDIVSIGSG